MSNQYIKIDSAIDKENILAGSSEILTHTADVRVRVTSETLPGLFQLGMQSLNQLLKPDFDSKKHKATIAESVQLESMDTTTLLIDFLSEVLTLSQVQKAIFFDFTINKMTDFKLTGILKGTAVDDFSEDVKAVTYHEAEVKVNDNGDWETVIIFDI